MAWISSDKISGAWWLTHEFSVERFRDIGAARGVSAALGFNSERVDHEAVKAEVVRAETNRALLVKQIADKVLAGVAAGATTTPAIDPKAIADLVANEFAERLKG
jgi:hypothetical protein